jgi:hypothetical protein
MGDILVMGLTAFKLPSGNPVPAAGVNING